MMEGRGGCSRAGEGGTEEEGGRGLGRRGQRRKWDKGRAAVAKGNLINNLTRDG